jgi:hypothetical protein
MGHDKTIKQGILQRYIKKHRFESRFWGMEKRMERKNRATCLNHLAGPFGDLWC